MNKSSTEREYRLAVCEGERGGVGGGGEGEEGERAKVNEHEGERRPRPITFMHTDHRQNRD